MAFTGVPMFIGGGSARHAASVVRCANYVATQGQQGVLGELDLRVLELATPGAAIRLSPGAAVLRNTASGGSYESYLDKSNADIEVPINPTGTAGGRNDLIIVRVEDPYVSGTGGPAGGWPVPTDAANGPYIFARVIENVGTNADGSELIDVSQAPTYANWTATTHARINIPANTGTITQAMVTDLRSIAELGGQRTTTGEVATQVWADNVQTISGSILPGTNAAFIDWPAEGVWQVPVPEWAGGVDVVVDWNPITAGHVWGSARLMMGGTETGTATPFDQNWSPGGGGYRPTIKVGGTYTIPPSLRGRTVEFKLQARQRAGEGFTLSDLTADAGTFVTFVLIFQRTPIYV